MEVSSQISHNLSNASNPNKTQIELWARAPGLLKNSVVIEFLGDHCNLGIHYTEERCFRICITSLNKDRGLLNQILLDMVADEQSFDLLFKAQNVEDFMQEGITGKVKPDY